MDKEALRRAVLGRLKWMVVGSGLEPRPHDEQLVAIQWIERAIDSLESSDEDLDAALLAGLMDGTFELNVEAGEVRFRLTSSGHEKAKDALMNDAEMRRFYQSLAGGAAVDEPKRKQ